MSFRSKNAIIYRDSVSPKKSNLHYTKTLKSGKVAHLCFYRVRWALATPREGEPRYVWNTALYISNTKNGSKEFRKWLDSPVLKVEPINGDGNLEALKWAYRKILWLVDNLPACDEVVVGHADEKRKRAYKYLERAGFKYNPPYREYYKVGQKEVK